MKKQFIFYDCSGSYTRFAGGSAVYQPLIHGGKCVNYR